MSEQNTGIAQDIANGDDYTYQESLLYEVHAHSSLVGTSILDSGFDTSLPCLNRISVNCSNCQGSGAAFGECVWYDGYGWWGSLCDQPLYAEPQLYQIRFSCLTTTDKFYWRDGFLEPTTCGNTWSGGQDQNPNYGIDTKIYTIPTGLLNAGDQTCAYYRWGGATENVAVIAECGGSPSSFVGAGSSALLSDWGWIGGLQTLMHGQLYCVRFGVEEYTPSWEYVNPYRVEIRNEENESIIDDSHPIYAVAARGTQFVCAGAVVAPGLPLGDGEEEGTSHPLNQVETDFVSIGAPISTNEEWGYSINTPIVAIKPRQDMIYETPYVPDGGADPDVYNDPQVTGQITNVFYKGYFIGFTIVRTVWQYELMHRYWFSWKVYLPIELIAFNGILPVSDDEYGFQFFGADVNQRDGQSQAEVGKWNTLFYDSRIEPFDVIQMTMVSNPMGGNPYVYSTLFKFDEQIGVASDYETHPFFLQEPISYNTMQADGCGSSADPCIREYDVARMHTFATAEGIMRAATISGYSSYNFETPWDEIMSGTAFTGSNWNFPFTVDDGTTIESYADASTKYLMSPFVVFSDVQTTQYGPSGSGNCANGNWFALGLVGAMSVHADTYNSSMMAVRPTVEDTMGANEARYFRTGSLTNMNDFNNGIFGTWVGEATWNCGTGLNSYGEDEDGIISLWVHPPLYVPGLGPVTYPGGIRATVIRLDNAGSVQSFAVVAGNPIFGAWTRRSYPAGAALVSDMCPFSCNGVGEDITNFCSGLIAIYGCGGSIENDPCPGMSSSCYPSNAHPDEGGNLVDYGIQGGSFPYNFIFRSFEHMDGRPDYLMLINFNSGIPNSLDYVQIEDPLQMRDRECCSSTDMGRMLGCGSMLKL